MKSIWIQDQTTYCDVYFLVHRVPTQWNVCQSDRNEIVATVASSTTLTDMKNEQMNKRANTKTEPTKYITKLPPRGHDRTDMIWCSMGFFSSFTFTFLCTIDANAASRAPSAEHSDNIAKIICSTCADGGRTTFTQIHIYRNAGDKLTDCISTQPPI